MCNSIVIKLFYRTVMFSLTAYPQAKMSGFNGQGFQKHLSCDAGSTVQVGGVALVLLQ